MRTFGARGITVSFGGVDVVANVDLDLRAGEIHALVGENGAGKSSLAKVLAGVYCARSGSVLRDDEPISVSSPRDALAQGIALIHQEPLSFPDLTVAESIFVGQQPLARGVIAWREMESKARELLAQLGVDLDPRRSVGGLSIAQQQQVELAHALAQDAQVWIFDETTAPLTPKEVGELFAVMRRLRDQGCALLMVTHHLHEVFAVADRITVLRDGAKVGDVRTSETTQDAIVRAMVGRELAAEQFHGSGPISPLLEVRKLSGPGFSEVSLKVGSGEVVGIAGLVGAGRTELARALFGITQPTSGMVALDERPIFPNSPREAMELGIALVPEDRRQDGLLMPQAISFNSSLAWLATGRGKLGSGDGKALLAANKTDLVYRDLAQPVRELSGGNQQKVVLGKWLMTQPRLLILDEPTRGVDVGAKHEVHRMIRELADQGVGVLMISSDLMEILALSDRVVVMRGGRVAATLTRNETSEEAIMRAAAGSREAEVA